MEDIDFISLGLNTYAALEYFPTQTITFNLDG